MTYTGTAKNGVVVFDEVPPLPDGVRVKVEPEQALPSTVGDRMMRFAGIIDDMPSDMAEKHDDYVHGPLTAEEWVQEWHAWAESHKPVGHFVDDSREAI